MILGLTLAEMLILLVFLLLLSAAALLVHREQEVATLTAQVGHLKTEMGEVEGVLRQKGVSVLDADNLVALLERGRHATETEAALAQTRDELATALQRVTQTENTLDGAHSELAAMRSQLQTLEHDRSALAGQLAETKSTVTQLAAERDQMAAMLSTLPGGGTGRPTGNLANFIGQYKQATDELARVKGNGGSGLPHCWASYPKGDPLYMLRITLEGATTQDIMARADDVSPRPNPADPAWPLIGDLPRGRFMPLSDLVGRVGGLSRRAADLKCHYAVEVIDHTAATNKPGYKTAMNRLWGVFFLHEIHD
jgi:hypothetical protein